MGGVCGGQVAEETFSLARVVRTFGTEEEEISRFESLHNSHHHKGWGSHPQSGSEAGGGGEPLLWRSSGVVQV